MSKSKRRVLHRNKEISPISCSREEAISVVTNSVKLKKFNKKSITMLSLFGISGEELAEAGLSWEELKSLSSYL